MAYICLKKMFFQLLKIASDLIKEVDILELGMLEYYHTLTNGIYRIHFSELRRLLIKLKRDLRVLSVIINQLLGGMSYTAESDTVRRDDRRRMASVASTALEALKKFFSSLDSIKRSDGCSVVAPPSTIIVEGGARRRSPFFRLLRFMIYSFTYLAAHPRALYWLSSVFFTLVCAYIWFILVYSILQFRGHL